MYRPEKHVTGIEKNIAIPTDLNQRGLTCGNLSQINIYFMIEVHKTINHHNLHETINHHNFKLILT